jgi:hypothetical protein
LISEKIANTLYQFKCNDNVLSLAEEKVKYIKTNIKPAPKGLGTFRVTGGAPAYMRLRHLRSRQVI